jgi:hypothetical protein
VQENRYALLFGVLQAAPWQGGAPGDQLLASSSRSEVLLWRADGFDTGPLHSWTGLARGRMNPAATQVCLLHGAVHALHGMCLHRNATTTSSTINE